MNFEEFYFSNLLSQNLVTELENHEEYYDDDEDAGEVDEEFDVYLY